MSQPVVVATTVAALALGAGSAYAQSLENESGLYVGGGVGQFDIDINGIDGIDEAVERLDDDDTAWQAFIGWRLNPFLALQVAYIDFGRPEDDFSTAGSSGNYKADISGFAPTVIGTLPAGPIELFAKIGYYFYDLEITANLDDLGGDVFRSDDSGEDVMWGGGVGVTLFERLSAKLEYEWIDLENVDDANALWLTGAWRF